MFLRKKRGTCKLGGKDTTLPRQSKSPQPVRKDKLTGLGNVDRRCLLAQKSQGTESERLPSIYLGYITIFGDVKFSPGTAPEVIQRVLPCLEGWGKPGNPQKSSALNHQKPFSLSIF